MELGEKWPVNLACDSDFHVYGGVLLHAVNLRHGTEGFTSLKEDMLWIFSPEKSDGFRPGSNPRSWVPEGSMLTTRSPKPLLMKMEQAQCPETLVFELQITGNPPEVSI
jgi:hypothetical protein